MKEKRKMLAELAKHMAEIPDAERMAFLTQAFAVLPTIDLEGVPILSAGGPYHGTGSPPEGDFFTKADLELYAEQTNKLQSAGELTSPSKLGHSEEQRLLENSGMPVGDELPAAGWLTNFTVQEIKGIWKLCADVKGIPAKLGQIFQAGGYRTRSVELSRVTSQVDGTTYDGVVTGLAWLGAKAPAVRTLDDVWNLYAVGDVVWEAEDGIMDLMSDLTAAINAEANPDQPQYMWNYWVQDINLALNRCVICDWDGDQTWIAKFKVQKTGPNGEPNEPSVDTKEKWIPATMKLVEIDPAMVDDDDDDQTYEPIDEGEYSNAGSYFARRQNARQKFLEGRADTKVMKLTDKQVEDYAKVFSLEGEGAALRTAVESHIREFAGEPAKPEPTKPEPVATLSNADDVQKALEGIKVEGMTGDQVKAFAAGVAQVITPLAERANRGDRAYADRFAEKRDSLILGAVKSYRIDPKDVENWAEFYDANPELCAKQLSTLPVNPLYVLTYGSDADTVGNEYDGAERSLSTEGQDAYLAATGAGDPVQAGAAA